VAQHGDADGERQGGDRQGGQDQVHLRAAELRQRDVDERRRRKQGGGVREPLELLALHPARAARPDQQRGDRRQHHQQQHQRRHDLLGRVAEAAERVDRDRVGQRAEVLLADRPRCEGVAEHVEGVHGHGGPQQGAPPFRRQPPGREQEEQERQQQKPAVNGQVDSHSAACPAGSAPGASSSV
jgi:hypothetical protein